MKMQRYTVYFNEYNEENEEERDHRGKWVKADEAEALATKLKEADRIIKMVNLGQTAVAQKLALDYLQKYNPIA